MAMAIQSIAARCKSQLRKFGAAQDGNAAMIFALAMLPTIGLMGAAIDYSRASAVRTDLQAALDSAALMVSKTAPTMTADEMRAAAQRYVEALFKYNSSHQPTIEVAYNATSSTVTLTGTTSVNSDFMQYVSSRFAYMPVNATSSVSWGMSRLRVALALDNTGSMASSSKMTALKAASKNLLTQLQSAAQRNGDVYVSIVPFAKDVNVGSGNYNTTWVDFRDHTNPGGGTFDGWDSLNGTCAAPAGGGGGGGGGGGRSGNGSGSGNNGNGGGNTNYSQYKTKKNCVNAGGVWTAANHNTWTGCVTDRDQNHDAANTTPDSTVAATLFVAENYSDCPTAMMTQSYNWTALKDKIDAMTPAGNTNITIGLAHAWQTLTPGAPYFPPDEDTNYQYKKVIILLTDGDNTQNRFTGSSTDIDARTSAACEGAKGAGITIYTVLVMAGNQSLLQSCATDSNKYFFLNAADGLVATFNQIGTDLTNLHVSR